MRQTVTVMTAERYAAKMAGLAKDSRHAGRGCQVAGPAK